MSGKTSRTKGQRGEREVAALIADLLGVQASRRCRQRESDSDILGVPGWSIEVKRRERADPADVARWWAQACAQAQAEGSIPCLWYRASRQPWRVMWPISVLLAGSGIVWDDPDYAVIGTPQAWAAVVREAIR
ncbi:MAG: hypothetical protein N2690_05350 [Rhodocyclaceae bacterium]|nr:hypothetical protein [Rhodocyclaceae bacterium]